MLGIFRNWLGSSPSNGEPAAVQLPRGVSIDYEPHSGLVSVRVGGNSISSSLTDVGCISASMNGVEVDLNWIGHKTYWFNKPIQIPGAPPNPALAGAKASDAK